MTEQADLVIDDGASVKKPPQPQPQLNDTGGDFTTTKSLPFPSRKNETVVDMLHIKHKLSPTNISDSEEGFLSTSPDSANGETMKPTQIRAVSNTQSTTNTNTDLSTNEQSLKTSKTMTAKTTPKSLYTCADPSKCVSLKNILNSFKSPLSEEQAWALIYQYILMYRNCVASVKRHIFTELEIPHSMENMNLHSDGSVHCSIKNKNEQQQQQQQQQKDKIATTNNNDDNYDNNGQKPEIQTANKQQQHQEQEEQAEDERNGDDTVSLMIASHKKILRKVAIIVYTALDYNLQADEQCQMSQELEELITFMASDDNDDCIDDCIDEGIDEGYNENETKDFDYVLDICKKHVMPTVPEEHYKAVVRALVTETIELRIFLQQVLGDGADKLHLKADAQTSKQELAKLGFNDWARFWVQVIDQLRRGVRLKKNNYERAPIEYELTPYEILMEDIRTKKYQLRKVMVNGDIPPRVKKDAHALILEFIRSRPPLKKASERKLPPPIKRNPSPREQLMDSIRKGQTLKHVTPPTPMRLKDRLLPPTTATSATTITTTATTTAIAATATVRAILPKTSLETSNETLDALKLQENMEPQTTRSKLRLIKVDFSLLQDDDNIFDEPLNSASSINATSIGICSQPKMPPYPIGGYIPSDSAEMATATRTTTTAKGPVTQIPTTLQTRTLRRTKLDDTENKTQCPSNSALEYYDLVAQSDSRSAATRRHTIVGCQSNFDESNSMPSSRPNSRQSDVHATSTTSGAAEQSSDDGNDSENQMASTSTSTSTSTTTTTAPWNKSFFDEKTWKERGEDHLSLSLDEIVHIRSVITKAQLEGLPVEVRVREDVEKRKICFLCLRTRFWFLGPRGIQCKLCQRTVCTKCSTKMRIPSEHFRNVPLVLISPSLLASPAGSNTPSPSHHARYMHSSSTGNIMDETFPKSLIERLLHSESEQKTRQTVGSAPASPKHQRSNISTPGIAASVAAVAATAAASGQAVEALHANIAMTSSYPAAAGYYARPENSILTNCRTQQLQQQHLTNRNISNMSRSMEGPRSLPANSPARSIHSNCSTLDRKSKISRAFTLSASGSQLNQQEQKENMRGELVPVCNDCKGLVMEITRSSRHRSSARNRALKNMTLDLSPVYK